MAKLTKLDWLALALMIIGALNWGLVGIFKLDIVEKIFGSMSALSRIVYTLVGIAAAFTVIHLRDYQGKTKEHPQT